MSVWYMSVFVKILCPGRFLLFKSQTDIHGASFTLASFYFAESELKGSDI